MSNIIYRLCTKKLSIINLIEQNITFVNKTKISQHFFQSHRSFYSLINNNKPFKYDDALKNLSTFMLTKNAHTKQYNKNEKKTDDSDSDSDDEYKGKKVMGNTDFWRRKMRTLHSLLDVNNDGVISYDDFCLLAKNFANIGHLTADEYLEFQKVIKQSWEIQFGEISPYNLINAEQYLQEMHHMINDHDLREKIHYFLPYLFKAVDKDKSGFISLNEFKIFFKCLGLTDENAAVSFAIIDKNGDGKLSIKEFVKLGRDFFLTENEKRISRMFWGPLLQH